MNSDKSARQFFELNLKYNRMLEQAGTQVITHGEDAVLYWLYAAGEPLLSGEISRKMELSSGRTANILGSLEKKGLILRKRNSPDKRQVSVCLTDSGRTKIEGRYRDCIHWYQGLLSRLGERETGVFLRLAEQVVCPPEENEP